MKKFIHLENMTCLITRPGAKGHALCAEIEAHGGRAIYFRTIDFAPPPDAQAFQAAIAQLGKQDWLIFISPQAVEASLPSIRQAWPVLPRKVKCAAIGEGTASGLRAAGYAVTSPARTFNSESLLDLPVFQSVGNLKIAIIRGLGGREKVDHVLAERGACVLPVIAYQRILPVLDSQPVIQLLNQNAIDIAVCTSFDSVMNLKILLGEANWGNLQKLPLLVMSERIKMLAQDLGFQRIWVTKQASQTSILEALAEIKDHLMTDEKIEKIEKPEKKPAEVFSKRSSFGMILLLLAFLVAAGGFGYGYVQLSQINLLLAKKVSDLQTIMTQQQDTLAALQQSLPAMQENIKKVETLSNQQEKRLSDWKQAQVGDTDKWKVAEAEYLTKMAEDNLQFSHNIKMALVLLQQANGIVTSVSDPRLLSVREALTADIARLQALPVVDATALFLQLKALNEQIDKLPLKTALQEEPAPNKTVSKNLSWWRAGLQKSEDVLSRIVIVRKTNSDSLPLSLPEEKQWLYLNLHTQLENATWGVLHGNKDVYQDSLSHMITWIRQYFVPQAVETKAMLQALEALQQAEIVSADYSLADTLKQFDNYFAEPKPVQMQ